MARQTSALQALFALLATGTSSEALAWGATGHRLIGEMASQSLPIEVPQFLRTREAARQIGEVAREPDRSKGAGQPHDADADPAHHINLGDDLTVARGPALAALPPTRESYDTALRMVGTNEYRAGFLPYAIVDGWEQLVIDLAYWRADVAGAKKAQNAVERAWFLRDQYMREGITTRDLGFLAHFVGDGSQPMHVSVHFDGWGNYPNPRNFSNQPGLHAKFEGAFVRARITASDIAAHMSPYHDCQCSIQQRVAGYLTATAKTVTIARQFCRP